MPVSLQVQLQLLTAIVKLFLKKPTETQELVQQVLSLATQVGAPASPLWSRQPPRVVLPLRLAPLWVWLSH